MIGVRGASRRCACAHMPSCSHAETGLLLMGIKVGIGMCVTQVPLMLSHVSTVCIEHKSISFKQKPIDK
jgi:hypothetical protein